MRTVYSGTVELQEVVTDLASSLISLDTCGKPWKHFQPGVGPYGEPQLLRYVAQSLNGLPAYGRTVQTRRTPDLLILGHWAIEFKLARPFGDNGKEAENWSVNLLHPYAGNVSLIGDSIKLLQLDGSERKAVVAIGYEHTPPRICLSTLFDAFEVIAREVVKVNLGTRIQLLRPGLCHPVHQQLVIAAWQVLPSKPSI